MNDGDTLRLNLDGWLSGCVGAHSIVGIVVGTCFAEVLSLAAVDNGRAAQILREVIDLLDEPETRSETGAQPIAFVRAPTARGEPHFYVQRIGEHYVVVLLFTARECEDAVRLVTKGIIRKFEEAGAARPS
jgi:hypothetical protein